MRLGPGEVRDDLSLRLERAASLRLVEDMDGRGAEWRVLQNGRVVAAGGSQASVNERVGVPPGLCVLAYRPWAAIHEWTEVELDLTRGETREVTLR